MCHKNTKNEVPIHSAEGWYALRNPSFAKWYDWKQSVWLVGKEAVIFTAQEVNDINISLQETIFIPI